MTETSPVIDFSVVWNKIDPKEPTPFQAGMVVPTSDDAAEGTTLSPGRLVCQIQIFDVRNSRSAGVLPLPV